MPQADPENDTSERRRIRSASDAFVEALKAAEIPPRDIEPGDNGRMILRHRSNAPASAGSLCVDFAY